MTEQKHASDHSFDFLRNAEPVKIAPSALESAFDAEIKMLGSALLPPYINESDQMVRLATPVEVNGNVVAFEYRRFDPLKTIRREVAEMVMTLNPSVRETIGQYDEPDDFLLSDTEISRRLHFERSVLDAVQHRVRGQDGKIDPLKALSDPRYYSEGEPLLRWPERFDVAIFESEDQVPFPLEPSQLGSKGKLCGIPPDIWARLTTSLQYYPNRDAGKSELTIRHPKREYETLLAYNQAFLAYPDENIRDIGSVNWFPTSRQWTRPVFPTQQSPEEIMGAIGTFVRELTKE